MKVYFPVNLNYSLESDGKLYGWTDESTRDIFICSFSNPNWFPEFKDIEIEECREMGILSSDPIDGMLSIQLKDFQMFLNFPNVHNSQSTVLIYYKICRDLSKSADFSSNFSSFPLKQVKWASIVNCNRNGRFLQLTKFQKVLSNTITSFLSIEIVKQFTFFAHSNSFRSLCEYSQCFEQFFRKKDHLSELYKYLLLNESVLSDSGRNNYRNNLILTVGDLILGCLLLPYILSFSFPFIKNSFFKSVTIDFFEEYLDWFMGWPAGFKFNANLTKFLGKFFLSLLAIWKVIIFPNLEINNKSAELLCNFKNFGLSLVIGIISDFWTISTLHCYAFYLLMAKIYWFYCVLILSLFRLFRGRKWNTLRNRVDATEYTMDQLLVGMLLFSMLFCTFPTIVAYYWLFTAALLFFSSIKCALESITILLNSFPVYFLVLKFSNNPIITAGFRLLPWDLKSRTPIFILTLDPPSYTEIFSDLWAEVLDCWLRIFNVKNVYNILVGRPITIIERINK